MSTAMRRLGVFSLILTMTAGWWFGAWWTVPVAAFLYGLVRRARRAPREALIAALIACLALTARWALLPAFPRLLSQLGAIFPMPGIAVMLLGVLLSSLLAYASARVAIGLAGANDS